ncbi:hypothetical protein [Tenacibaculum agarivorans]|uniref:hypothetical protein n=1 Tax=Tenacibaculum agarivorans TaxID=1908389 RepID=UPI00094B8117|nr:hypothetical protein [Tenacibaculum agarivorans]
MNKLVCKLKNVDDLNMQSLQKRIDNGYRFVVYQYSISLIAGNIFTVSPAYLLKKEDTKKHTLKYNLLSSILGWWSLNGVTNTLKSLKTNSRGGIDVTEDIILNLNRDSLLSKKVKIKELHTIFRKPDKSTIKDFVKSIDKTKSINIDQNIYLGRYLNTESFSYFIAFDTISETNKKELMTSLRKVFYKHVHIEILKINPKDEITQKLTQQGFKLHTTKQKSEFIKVIAVLEQL